MNQLQDYFDLACWYNNVLGDVIDTSDISFVRYSYRFLSFSDLLFIIFLLGTNDAWWWG